MFILVFLTYWGEFNQPTFYEFNTMEACTIAADGLRKSKGTSVVFSVINTEKEIIG